MRTRLGGNELNGKEEQTEGRMMAVEAFKNKQFVSMLSKSVHFFSSFYQIINFGMWAILSQSSPLSSSHRFFKVEQPLIVKTSSEVRCRIPSGKDLNASLEQFQLFEGIVPKEKFSIKSPQKFENWFFMLLSVYPVRL